MAGLKSSTQSDMARHQKPLSAMDSESLLLEGPYLATNLKAQLFAAGLFLWLVARQSQKMNSLVFTD
jgi:hypothetical protein